MKITRLMAAMALVGSGLGLTACGGGGDAVIEETLTAGLTLRESTLTSTPTMNGTYNLTVLDSFEQGSSESLNAQRAVFIDTPGNTSFVAYEQAALINDLGTVFAQATINSSGQVVRVVVARITGPSHAPGASGTPVGCGIGGHPCSGITVAVNATTHVVTVTAKSAVLKALNTDWSGLDSAGGQLKASGIATFTPPA